MWLSERVLGFLKQMRALQRMNVALARGSAGLAGRVIDLRDPRTWEFSGFSQNGEDGLIDVLSRQILAPNRYFLEIGASDGLENNTAWLSLVRRYGGLWVEGDASDAKWAAFMFARLNYGVETVPLFVTITSAAEVVQRSRFKDPDVASIDIDGVDLYIARALLEAGLRPRIWVVEYNSAFGPERAVTIPFDESFRVGKGSGADLYYGCSLAALRRVFGDAGYRFVTVDSNGVNGVFVDPKCFDSSFLDGINGLEFRENVSHVRAYGAGWTKHYHLISDRRVEQID